jgi:drug/metabolite transporter (DMT)-like permease
MTAAASRSGGLGLSLVSAASFSTSGSFARSLTDAGWSPAAAVAIRCTVAALLLAVPAAIEMRAGWSALRRGARTVVVYGVVTVAGCQVCYFNAVQHMPVGLALLLEYLGIVLIVAWLWWRGQRPSRVMVAGSVIALVGLWFVIDPSGHVDAIGVVWALGAAVGLATYFILSANTGGGLPPATLACGGMIVGTVAVLGCGAIGVVPLHATGTAVALGGHRVPLWLPVIGLGLVATAIPYVTGIHAARRLGPKLASFVSLTEVIFAVIAAWLLLDELPTVWQIVGGAIIVIGVALVRLDELIR